MAKEINPSKMSIHEVLELVAKAPTKVEKSKVLKTYESLALKTMHREQRQPLSSVVSEGTSSPPTLDLGVEAPNKPICNQWY